MSGYQTTQVEEQEKRFTIAAEYDGNSLLLYFADALPGTATSSPLWRIRKLLYDGNGNFTRLIWPNGDTTNNYVWDIRSTYSYS